MADYFTIEHVFLFRRVPVIYSVYMLISNIFNCQQIHELSNKIKNVADHFYFTHG